MSTAIYDLDKATAAWREGRPTPVEAIVGRRAIFTTYEGVRLEGVVEADPRGGRYPRARFADGTWGRLDSQIELVNR